MEFSCYAIIKNGEITGMSIIWQERGHEDMDREYMHEPLNLNALHLCGLLKFFHMMNMPDQPRLLETLVRY